MSFLSLLLICYLHVVNTIQFVQINRCDNDLEKLDLNLDN